MLTFAGASFYDLLSAPSHNLRRFAASLRRARWLGRSAAFAMIALSLVAAFLLALRGLSFPDPKVALTSWYTTAGWVAGIPAIPWMIPCVMGIVLLWRAGSRQIESHQLSALGRKRRSLEPVGAMPISAPDM